MKILLYDIETIPNISYTWGKYDQNVIDFQKEWELLSFSYKELDHAKISCITRLSFKDSTDKSLTKALHKVLSEADILIAHNGKQFDNKKANAKFIEHGLKPLAPKVTIDTRDVARQHFKFNSNKLDDLGKLLGVGRKFPIAEGFDLWLKCMAGDKKAFATMARYNKQDVVLLEKVYKKLLPWIKHPTMSLSGCPKCGSHNIQSRGVAKTTTVVYNRYQCQDCGGWSRSRQSLRYPKPQKVSL